MTDNAFVNRLVFIGVLVLVLALAIGYGIGVAIGDLEFGFEAAFVFVLHALVTIVPLLIVLGFLPAVIVIFALHKKDKKSQSSIENDRGTDA